MVNRTLRLVPGGPGCGRASAPLWGSRTRLRALTCGRSTCRRVPGSPFRLPRRRPKLDVADVHVLDRRSVAPTGNEVGAGGTGPSRVRLAARRRTRYATGPVIRGA